MLRMCSLVFLLSVGAIVARGQDKNSVEFARKQIGLLKHPDMKVRMAAAKGAASIDAAPIVVLSSFRRQKIPDASHMLCDGGDQPQYQELHNSRSFMRREGCA